jgi:hypothetical protein
MARPDAKAVTPLAVKEAAWPYSAKRPAATRRSPAAERSRSPTARIRAPHGFVVCDDGTRHRVENNNELRGSVLELVKQILVARANVSTPISVNPQPGQCRPCGMRGHCGQSML